MRTSVKVLLGVIAVVVVLVAGAAIWVSTIDLDDVKLLAQRTVKEATGRELAIGGKIELSISWSPRVRLTDVRFQNAAWGSRPEMATVGELDLALDIVDLLGGRIDVNKLVLKNVDVLLETDKAGKGNWEIAVAAPAQTGQPGGSGGAPTLPLVRSVELEGIAVTLRDGTKGTAQRFVLDKVTLAAKDASAPVRTTIKADLDGRSIELAGTIPSLQALASRSAALPVMLDGTVMGQSVSLAATLRPDWKGDALAGAAVTDLKAKVGASEIAGQATLKLDGKRPYVGATLASKSLDAKDFEFLRGKPSGSGTAVADPLDEPIPYDLLMLADADAAARIDAVVTEKLSLTQVDVTVKLLNGVLTIAPSHATVAEGRATVSGVIDGARRPGTVRLEGDLKNADFGMLARELQGSDKLRGRGDALWRLAAAGPTPRALIGSADGFSSTIIREGSIDAKYWELIAADLTTQLLQMMSEGGASELNCMVSRFDFKGGKAAATVLLVDSKRITMVGEGVIDMQARTLDMLVTPKPKNTSLVSLAMPLLVQGPVDNPTVLPDPKAVAKGVAGMALKTVNPLFLALPLLSLGSDEPPCPIAIAVAEGRQPPKGAAPAAGGGAPAQQAPSGPADAVKGLFDGLKKLVP